MLKKFFTNTIESKFIQSLLFNSYIPIYDTVNIGDKVIKDKVYAYKHYIIKCTETGELDKNFSVVGHYKFGEKKKQYLKNYVSKNNYYDDKTHRYLGDYLRCYRDIYGVDLMPFYNCFNYYYMKNSSNDISIRVTPRRLYNGSCLYPGNSWPSDNLFPSDGSLLDQGSEQSLYDGSPTMIAGNISVEAKQNQDGVITYLVPVKFNKVYTIALDSPTKVVVKGCLCNDNGLLMRGGYSLSDDLPDKGAYYSQTRFNAPFTYTIETEDLQMFNRERFLYLAIQISKANDSSIVVLEGDYTHNATILSNNNNNMIPIQHIINNEYQITDKQCNAILRSDLSLLLLNNKNIYAYSDKLIEYLLQNTITNQEQFSGNIKRTQDQLNNTVKMFSNGRVSEYNENAVYGIWDNKIRYYAYKYFMEHNNKHQLIDVNGFVDKSIEDFLITSSNKYVVKSGG